MKHGDNADRYPKANGYGLHSVEDGEATLAVDPCTAWHDTKIPEEESKASEMEADAGEVMDGVCDGRPILKRVIQKDSASSTGTSGSTWF